MQARRSLKRSLETAAARAVSLGEARAWQASTGKDMPPLIHKMRHFLRQAQFFFGEADFLFSSIHQKPTNPPKK